MQAVLFDLDGTLLHTLPDIALCLNETLKLFRYPVCTDEQVRRFVGDGAEKLIERALPEGANNAEEVYRKFRELYGRSSHALTRPYEGIEELLRELKGRGVKLAVITNKPQEATVSSVGKFFKGVFDYIGGDSGMFPVKPDPAHARYCALTLRVPIKECVFVGDGEPDVRTAKSAGMRSVSALWGYRTREELLLAGATEFASSPEELQKILAEF